MTSDKCYNGKRTFHARIHVTIFLLLSKYCSFHIQYRLYCDTYVHLHLFSQLLANDNLNTQTTWPLHVKGTEMGGMTRFTF